VPAERLEHRFEDKKPPMTRAQAVAEANRCLYCFDAPCIKACPTQINIPEFIRKIATGNLGGSAKTILRANILGMSCARVCPVEVLCEGDCVYNNMGSKPIEIGRLQRYATEHAYDRNLQYWSKGTPTGKRVALVGAGPSSLACAHELTKLGHEAVLFEANDFGGGLNSTGVAPYKLFVEDSLREVDYVQQIGFEIRYGVEVGKDVSFEALESDFDAVFLGIGLGPDGWMGIDGEDLDGVVGGLELIGRIKLGDAYELPDIGHAVIIGGGNTAMDVVRGLCGLGVPRVTLLYRRNRAAMPGYDHEWTAARASGARGVWWSQPVALEGRDGRVEAVRYLRARPSDPDNPRSKLIYRDEAHRLEADLVVMAIGQATLADWVAQIGGVRVERGRIVVDEHGQTTNPRYFSGGDCANGGKEVVNAAAEGKRAAQGIHSFLSGAQAAAATSEN
jgi:glutamate synthase (NADPH/NADH) small chain